MYVVIFKATVSQLDEQYIETAKLLRHLALVEFGCIAFEAVSEGAKEIALSYWQNKSDIVRWKKQAQHLTAQRFGQEHWYSSYSVEIAKIERSYAHHK